MKDYKKIKTFKDIIAWQKAHDVVLMVYEITKKFPDYEKFGLVTQMRRAIVSVASNIVEGFARKNVKESLHFYNIANASLEEVKYQILICKEVNIINNEEYNGLIACCDETGKTLHGWTASQYSNTGLSR